jgi:hypothetical protein
MLPVHAEKETPRRRVIIPSAVRGALLCVVMLMPCLTSCHATTFRVGLGGNGLGQATMHQYYLFFGLIRLNEVDIQRVVGDYTSYDVEAGFAYRDGFLTTCADFFVSTLFLPLTVTRQAVTVKY